MKFSALLGKVRILNDDFAVCSRNLRNAVISYTLIRPTCRYQRPHISRIIIPAVLGSLTRNAWPSCSGDSRKKVFSLILSNSKVPEIEELYCGFTIDTVDAKRFINCNGQRRKGTQEIIVTNYEY